jgi:hypothetical protein
MGIVLLLAGTNGGSLFAALTANSASNAARDSSNRVASVAHANYETCLSNNQFRQDTRQLWNSVLVTLGPLVADSPKGQTAVAAVQQQVDLTTTPRVCKPA